MLFTEDKELVAQAEKYISTMYFVPKNKRRAACCEFYPLNDKVGIKAYRKYGDAADTHHMQTIFARYGCAPKVLSDIHRTHCPKPNCEYVWYLTERVKLLSEFCADSDKSKNWYGKRDCCRKMLKLGANLFGDAHDGNFGVDENGRVVCIDFSWYVLEPKNLSCQGA